MTDFEQKLTWIFGSPRTGSTWLLRMLIYPWKLRRNELGFAQSPRYSGSASYPSVVPINESHLPKHLSRLVRYRGLPTETEQEVIDQGRDLASIFNPHRADNASFFFSRHYEDAWRPATRELALARFAAQAQRAETELSVVEPTVLIKEPNGSFAADLIFELLPQSRMIFLIRDCRDVVDSQLAMQLPGGKYVDLKGEIRTESERLEFITIVAQRWVNCTKICAKAFERLSPEQRIMIRYESLRSDPAGALRELFEFLAIERSDAEIAETVAAEDFSAIPDDRRGIGTGKRAASPGLWRENLTEREQETVVEIAGPTMREYGYEA